MAETLTISIVVWIFCELGTRYTGIYNFEALRELPDTKS